MHNKGGHIFSIQTNESQYLCFYGHSLSTWIEYPMWPALCTVQMLTETDKTWLLPISCSLLSPHSPSHILHRSQRIFTKCYSVLSLHYFKFSMAFSSIYNKIQISSRLPVLCPSQPPFLPYSCQKQCFVFWPSQCSSKVQLCPQDTNVELSSP